MIGLSFLSLRVNKFFLQSNAEQEWLHEPVRLCSVSDMYVDDMHKEPN